MMAIWQFSVDFIQRKKLIERFGAIPKSIADEILWKENLEEGVELPDDYEKFLHGLGEREKLKWTPNSINWGDYDDGTHFAISFNKIGEASVFCRFDIGNWDEEFAKTVLKFAKMCDCVLLTKNENVIEPKLGLLVEEMKNSNSFRFCKDPKGYLLSDEVKEINRSVKNGWKVLLNGKDNPNR